MPDAKFYGNIEEEGYYKDGQKYINNYWNPKKEQFIENGKGKIIEQTSFQTNHQEYLNGLEHGMFKIYNDEDNQLLQEGNYKNGKKEGKFIRYYIGGSIRSIMTYKNGELLETLNPS